jgi:hypothetical protein
MSIDLSPIVSLVPTKSSDEIIMRDELINFEFESDNIENPSNGRQRSKA